MPYLSRFAIGFFGTFIAGFAAVWVFVITNPSTRPAGTTDWWWLKVEMIRKCDIGTLVIMGDSIPAMAYIPSHIGAGVVNLAIGATTPVQGYLFSHRILSCPKLPKAVIMSYAPDHYGGDIKYMVYLSQMNVSSFSELEDVRRYSRNIGVNIYEQYGDAEIMVQELGYVTRFPPYYFSQIVWRLLYPPDREGAEKNRRKRGEWLDDGNQGSRDLAGETRFGQFKPWPLYDHYFEASISDFESHNIPVYYVIPPISDISMRAMHPQFIAEFIAYLNGMADRHPNFHLLISAYTALPWTLYRDGDHLNREGALLWSEQVRKRLNKANVPGGPFIPEPNTIDETGH